MHIHSFNVQFNSDVHFPRVLSFLIEHPIYHLSQQAHTLTVFVRKYSNVTAIMLDNAINDWFYFDRISKRESSKNVHTATNSSIKVNIIQVYYYIDLKISIHASTRSVLLIPPKQSIPLFSSYDSKHIGGNWLLHTVTL